MGHFFVTATFILGVYSAKAQPPDRGGDITVHFSVESHGEYQEGENIKIRGYSDLSYGTLEIALQKRVKDLTDINISSITKYPCLMNGKPIDAEIWSVECYEMIFHAAHIRRGLSQDIFGCRITIGTYYPLEVSLYRCENNEFRLAITPEGREEFISFDELGIVPDSVDERKLIN